ncbi:MAG TPA: BON domain-containing protein [Pirellulaceae bacterium]|nr:BON domain-containing protein [Pirellulaceae bacterium]
MTSTNVIPAFDQQITAVVQMNPHLHRRKVQLRADEGHVVLCGQVNSFFEKQVAQEAVRSVQGVSSIDNQLEVCWNEAH